MFVGCVGTVLVGEIENKKRVQIRRKRVGRKECNQLRGISNL